MNFNKKVVGLKQISSQWWRWSLPGSLTKVTHTDMRKPNTIFLALLVNPKRSVVVKSVRVSHNTMDEAF